MLRKLILALIVLILFSSCTLVRVAEETKKISEINTVTKTTEIRQEYHNDLLVDLKTETFSETLSKEIANIDKARAYSAPPLGQAAGFLSKLTGGGWVEMLLAAVGALGAKKGYDVVRDSKPRNTPAEPMKELV